MKLVEILAKELKEWPSNTDSIWQDHDSELRFYGNRDTSLTNIYVSALCDDCLRKEFDSTPENRVTEQMWEAEKAKLNAQNTDVFAPIYCRDRIKEIDSMVESLEEERVSLVQALEKEGFSLIKKINKQIEECKQSHEDMSDWRNWKVGDYLEITCNLSGHEFSTGEVVKIGSVDLEGKGMSLYYLNDSDFWFADHNEVKFHSRPQ